ncbi:hypothetical protein [Variovorax paradoxus]|jgi:hypothetical protein|uniref:Uncharacterized protein n=1 Tax=Variovorax paradoxus TaxID=34073 RepID=A0A679JR11_VARPD|nr:hypothetical protein VVAX_06019 [Variovorax paradoxus]
MTPDEPERDVLTLLQRRAAALVALRLRSVSVVIARLAGLVGEAHALGHSHADIHARLRAAGLGVSWNNYRAALVRARRRAARARISETASSDVIPGGVGGTVSSDVGAGPAASPAGTREPGASPVALLDALANAQRAASRDYATAARALARKPRSTPP